MKYQPGKSLLIMLTVLLASISQYSNAQDISLNVGDDAPTFQAMSVEGDLWQSSENVGENLLVVYFYPAAMTGGCTAQACSFRDDKTVLTELGAEVVGISGDSIENLEIFKRAHNLNFPLLSDAEGNVAKAFGVPVRDGGTITREVDGEEVELTRDLTTSRWTFIIDREGKIVYKDTEVDAAGDSQTVISAIRSLAMN